MIEIRHIDEATAAGIDYLTFPALRPHLVEPRERHRGIVAAYSDGEPVGLAYALGGPRGEFELMSVYVAPLLRRRGIGGRLLGALERRFAEWGYRVGVHFFTFRDDDSSPALFLMRCGWSRPAVRKVVCETNLDLAFKTPWLVGASAPRGYRIVSWGELRDDQRAAIRQRQARDAPWYPPLLEPFTYEAHCERETSLALMRGDAVMGWLLTHAIGPVTNRVSCAYVSTEIQGAARMVPMLWELVQRQARDTPYTNLIWATPVHLGRMVRFSQRRMRPWLLWLGFASTSTKAIAGAA